MAQFHEEQHFQWIFAAIFFIPALIVGLGLYLQRGVAEPAVPGALLWPALAVTMAVAVWIAGAKLVTEVRADGLFIDFIWLWPERTIAWDQITSVEARTYRPVRDFGGWGVRWAARGIVYHARGRRGVRLILASGERVLVGSQRPDELALAIGAQAGVPSKTL